MTFRGTFCWAITLALLAVTTTGCTAVRVGGKSAADVFTGPQTLALVQAACDGNLAKIDALVKAGANVNATGYRDTTVLVWTMFCKNYVGVEKLLTLGANPNYKMEGDISAMWASAGSDDPHFLPIILAHGGDPNIWSGGNSALMIAMEQGRKQNFQLLLEHGADINAHEKGGVSTVATYAAALAKFNVVEELLKRGYDFDLEGLALGVNGRIVAPGLQKEKQHVLDMLKERGVKFPLPPPTIAPPAPGTKPPSWWHPKSSAYGGVA